ncbi:FMN-binding glutamate synthase family protein [Ampullimonas aquatilis]|uniref:FMN-binding glutamate synthase family protein n=1 Tax=Ampullimonas aquatilis TaxID=1341549 RepID=UPI003C72885F
MLPTRFLTLAAVCALTLFFAVLGTQSGGYWIAALICACLSVIGLVDLTQTRQAIRRNYPILAHFRFFFEYVRPELRQYIVEDDTEEKPFSRVQRSIVYQRAKKDPDMRPFGTLLDVKAAGYEWINHSMVPTVIKSHDFRILIGDGRAQPYSASIFNISAMSFGALSANAIMALNQGAAKGRFAHDTGEGSISRYHRQYGGDLIWEIGSGYFGCRNQDGTFNAEKFAVQAQHEQVKMIEIKLSQGAKPGHGGVLPAAKVTPEIAETRDVPTGEDCISPPSHSAFSTPIELLEFIDKLRTLSGGKPTGFKFCVGHPWEWFGIAKAMLKTGIVPDFIVIDGGEGGTGAAPVEFIDHVGGPLQEGLILVHNTLVGIGLRDQVKLGASGKIITAFDIARTLAIGADWCNSARGFMFALGCIQAQACHTGACPTGVTTQDPLRQRALVVPDKSERVYNFHQKTLHALMELVAAAGLSHPSQLRAEHIVKRISPTVIHLLSKEIPYLPQGALLNNPKALDIHSANLPNAHLRVFEEFWPVAQAESFHMLAEHI